MPEKKIFTLPNIRCNERMNERVRKAAEHLGVTPTAFIFQALVEKLERMELEWNALNSIFSDEAQEYKESIVKQRDAAAYFLFEEDVEG